GIGAQTTINANYLDFYLSFGLGLTLAIALIGFWHVGRGMLARREEPVASIEWRRLFQPPKGRGDIPILLALGIYIFSTTTSIATACFLLHKAHASGMGSPLTMTLIAVLIFYGFVY